jgi:hypothetical protein
VGVSQDLIWSDDESCSGSSAEAAAIPRCPVVRDLGRNFDFHNRVVKCWLWYELRDWRVSKLCQESVTEN